MPGVQETGTSKDEERLYDVIPGNRSIPGHYQIPNHAPVSKRHQNGTPKSADGSKDEPGKRSIPEHYQIPNDVPVSKRHQKGTPKSADGSKENHYMALKNDNVLKNDHYQKPTDIGVQRFGYENLGKDDDETDA